MSSFVVTCADDYADHNIGRLFYLFEPIQEQATIIELCYLAGSEREAFIHFGPSGRNIPFSVKEQKDIELSNWRSELLYSVDSNPPALGGNYWYDDQDKKWNYVPELGLLDEEKASQYLYDEQANLYYNEDTGKLEKPHLRESETLEQHKGSVEEINELLERRREFIYKGV